MRPGLVEADFCGRFLCSDLLGTRPPLPERGRAAPRGGSPPAQAGSAGGGLVGFGASGTMALDDVTNKAFLCRIWTSFPARSGVGKQPPGDSSPLLAAAAPSPAGRGGACSPAAPAAPPPSHGSSVGGSSPRSSDSRLGPADADSGAPFAVRPQPAARSSMAPPPSASCRGDAGFCPTPALLLPCLVQASRLRAVPCGAPLPASRTSSPPLPSLPPGLTSMGGEESGMQSSSSPADSITTSSTGLGAKRQSSVDGGGESPVPAGVPRRRGLRAPPRCAPAAARPDLLEKSPVSRTESESASTSTWSRGLLCTGAPPASSLITGRRPADGRRMQGVSSWLPAAGPQDAAGLGDDARREPPAPSGA